MVPPHDVPLAKKLMVDSAACRPQVCGNSASKRTSLGIRIAVREAPERIARACASTSVATLLKADRNAAVRNQISVATVVDASARAIRSGASRDTIRIPADVRFDALLPQTCGRQAALSTISFFANGTS